LVFPFDKEACVEKGKNLEKELSSWFHEVEQVCEIMDLFGLETSPKRSIKRDLVKRTGEQPCPNG
jgi:hypothetical protein